MQMLINLSIADYSKYGRFDKSSCFLFFKLPLMESDLHSVEMLKLRSVVESPLVVIEQVVDQIKKMLEDAKNLSDPTIIPTALIEICKFC